MILFTLSGTVNDVSAAINPPDMPEFTIEATKDGTGIKVAIEKNDNTDYFVVYVYDVDTPYTGYESEIYTRITINEDGSKGRTCTIKNLPNGKYKVGVAAFKYEYINENSSNAYGSDYWIKPITINVSTPKEKRKIPDFSKYKVGDIVTFGVYEQDGDLANGKEPIEWVVLSK